MIPSLSAPHPLQIMRKDAAEFRRALATFPTGVALVTAATVEAAVGMTVNSFSSVSLDPMLVLLCAAKTSQTWASLRAQESFAITILSARQEAISRAFASRRQDRFEGFEWMQTPEGHPVPAGALAWFDVRIAHLERSHAGDHDLAICEVIDWGHSAEGEALLFHCGQYGVTGLPIETSFNKADAAMRVDDSREVQPS